SLDEMAGVVFRYHTNRHYYLFSITKGKTARLAVRLPLEKTFRVAEWRVFGEAEFPYDTTKFYTLRVENEGSKIRASIDGRLVLSADDDERTRGKAGLTANIPARFQGFRVAASAEAKRGIDQRIKRRESELTALRAQNPKPQVWKKFATPKFGAGRNARF